MEGEDTNTKGRAPIYYLAKFAQKLPEKTGGGGGTYAADTIRLVMVSRVTLDTNRNSSEL